MSKSTMANIWSLPVLIVFWLVTLGGTVLGFYSSHQAWNWGYASPSWGDQGWYYSEDMRAWAIVLIVAGALTLIANIVSVVLYACHKLPPLYVLVFNAVFFPTWSLVLILSFVLSYGIDTIHYETFMSYAVGVLICASLGQLIYSSVLFHRQRRSQMRDLEAAARQNAPPAFEEAIIASRVVPKDDDGDSGFEDPAPDYWGVTGAGATDNGNEMQKINNA